MFPLIDFGGIPLDWIGFPKAVFPPVRSMREFLSSSTSGFAMASICLSAIGVAFTMKKEYPHLEKRYPWIAVYLFSAVVLWVTSPLASGQIVYQTIFVLWAFLASLAAGFMILIPYGSSKQNAGETTLLKWLR